MRTILCTGNSNTGAVAQCYQVHNTKESARTVQQILPSVLQYNGMKYLTEIAVV